MIWTYDQNPWRRRFAWLPVRCGGTAVWWQFYWARHNGYGGDEISFTDPAVTCYGIEKPGSEGGGIVLRARNITIVPGDLEPSEEKE